MPNITLRTTLEIITVVATCVIAATAVKGCSTEQQRSQQLESEVTAIKEQLKASDEELERRRRELQKSLTAYMSHYRTLISEANEAVAKYQNFDTPKNRKEYGKGFDQRKAELLKDAKPHIQALVDHVENWKPVLEAFGQMLDRLEGLAWLRFQYGCLRHRRLATVAGSQEQSMTTTPPNHAQRTAAGRRGCNRTPSGAGSLSLGR